MTIAQKKQQLEVYTSSCYINTKCVLIISYDRNGS